MLTLQTKKVSNMTKKGKHTVLFICLGNICRSPAAEGIMKSLVEKQGFRMSLKSILRASGAGT